MSERHGNILVDYQDADFTKRLHMFLQFPELRERFMAIDQQAPEVPAATDVAMSGARAKCGWRAGRLIPCFK
jgi:hypothetical protein